MIVLKGCTRCHGDLYVEWQTEAPDLVCLQCGYRRALRAPGSVANRSELRVG